MGATSCASTRSTPRRPPRGSRRHETRLGLLELVAAPGGKVTYRKVRTLDLPSSFTLPDGSTWTPCLEPGELPQVEGMVVDHGVLYAAQEDVGIWRLRADLTGRPVLMDRVKEYGRQDTYDPATEECVPGQDRGYGGRHLAADAEGLTVYQTGRDSGYLLASSQGDDTFAVYDRAGRNAYLGQFRVGPGNRTDGAEASDGAMATSAPLGHAYPEGLLVVHDGADSPPGLLRPLHPARVLQVRPHVPHRRPCPTPRAARRGL
ncbi:phytase [Nonomuraea sp. NBC_00507]|uniref:phytase n=1 Tax=Nonomuraea sp. NBC_00507 TaxID=2976002 RepID=UPI002E196E1A